ncbi:D-alanine--poly(phosphoribitol) ligase subunit 2 [Macrococcoides caseolyticum]|uniref:D-alanyl carrier protein n=1 Tax=Macrococcoides caseolyticum TaxID=69966 RepID=A0A855GU68_9STAP|nr:D-alanine--poly(phosphoribitol) ligase subunit 2 [Macrococcus caseolyticus]MDJ1152988.1 D-alanine--poly(phosphoribitol) ligase subunit 2 [Macrococcus caseolyticus]PKE11233.1 D-alanine--poly(phosphoribitol) ligase subunit 2 [Macrococcus caseolyticus]PKE22044.1 D-alanine--poly(phosphoribitol) ligase subunit 2 [Macrococcus caseolyticus]PKE27358.1 D-alanine--poly(phosphoribitol) ligase subunit 2 [Macrococcus caseolyticus]PKE47369.1 D-alanine--poly(phosphoribitol) ligase subunit 2 [Macrococcus c
MEFRQEVLDVIAEVAENNIVKENPDVRIFDENILDSFATVGLLLALNDRLDMDLTITDFDRDEWATPNMIAEVLEELR